MFDLLLQMLIVASHCYYSILLFLAVLNSSDYICVMMVIVLATQV